MEKLAVTMLMLKTSAQMKQINTCKHEKLIFLETSFYATGTTKEVNLNIKIVASARDNTRSRQNAQVRIHSKVLLGNATNLSTHNCRK